MDGVIHALYYRNTCTSFVCVFELVVLVYINKRFKSGGCRSDRLLNGNDLINTHVL